MSRPNRTNWNDKHALVTGGSAGLGLAFAHRAAHHGFGRLTLVGRDAERLAAAKAALQGSSSEISVETVTADLSRAGEAERAVADAAAVAPLDLVGHFAGRSSRGRVIETSRDEFQELLSINFLAAAELATAAGTQLAKRRGHLVLIGSLATRLAPPLLGAYPASKHPLAALAQQLRLEMGEAGLHTLLVCPGPIARDDAGQRYNDQAEDLPANARRPGGGANVKAIDPASLSDAILKACQHRQPELVVPKKARLLMAITQLWPSWGDWLLRKQMRSD